MKIFGIGCPRTGTTTLGDCFRLLGLNGTSFNRPLFHDVLRGELAGAIRYAEQFDAFEDLPWCLIFEKLDVAFPGSRFILTVRSSSAVWLRSYRRHHATEHGALLNADGSKAVYRTHEYPIWPAGVHGYEAHNAAVATYFRDRPGDLLTVCWERGDGWAQLCRFLDLPVPDLPFPRANSSGGSATTLKMALLQVRRVLRAGR
jgi:hypothetical protein